MNILAIGDVIGSRGCEAVRKHLPAIKKLKGVDLVIANGENSADGNGITPLSAEHLFTSGVDVITTGNHVFRRREIYEQLESNRYLLRPGNYPSKAPGRGLAVVDMGKTVVGVINLLGVVFLDNLECPFKKADELIDEAKKEGAKIIIVDFHAEATAEKRAMGFYLDGRISALFGTHTHVQTADETVLPNGTGYITDLGMVGPINSVLGVKPELAIAKMKDKLPTRFETSLNDCQLDASLFVINDKTAATDLVERLIFV